MSERTAIIYGLIRVSLLSAAVVIAPGFARAASATGLRLRAVRNEYAPFQVAVSTDTGAAGVSAAISDLIGPDGAFIRSTDAAPYLVENEPCQDGL